MGYICKRCCNGYKNLVIATFLILYATNVYYRWLGAGYGEGAVPIAYSFLAEGDLPKNSR